MTSENQRVDLRCPFRVRWGKHSQSDFGVLHEDAEVAVHRDLIPDGPDSGWTQGRTHGRLVCSADAFGIVAGEETEIRDADLHPWVSGPMPAGAGAFGVQRGADGRRQPGDLRLEPANLAIGVLVA